MSNYKLRGLLDILGVGLLLEVEHQLAGKRGAQMQKAVVEIGYGFAVVVEIDVVGIGLAAVIVVEIDVAEIDFGEQVVELFEGQILVSV